MSADAWGLRSTACSRYCSLRSHKRNLRWKLPTSHVSAHNHPRSERNLIAQQLHSEFPFLTWWFLKTNEEFLTRMSRARDYNKYHFCLPSSLARIAFCLSIAVFVELTYTIVKSLFCNNFSACIYEIRNFIARTLKKGKVKNLEASTPRVNERFYVRLWEMRNKFN